MKGCSQCRRDRQCIYTIELSRTTDLEKGSWKISYNHGKTAHTGTLSFIVPSRDVQTLFLGSIGAEVAWLVALRSLLCHTGNSYLARLTGYLTQDLSKRGAPAP